MEEERILDFVVGHIGINSFKTLTYDDVDTALERGVKNAHELWPMALAALVIIQYRDTSSLGSLLSKSK